MASAVVSGCVRIAWQDLPKYAFKSCVPAGARVVIDIGGIDTLPDKWTMPKTDPDRFWARDKFDFLDDHDQTALAEIAKAADRIEVEGDDTGRIATMVRFLRGAVEELEAARADG